MALAYRIREYFFIIDNLSVMIYAHVVVDQGRIFNEPKYYRTGIGNNILRKV